MTRNVISREVAANVLFHFRGEGFPGGSFIEALLTAFARADIENHLRLSIAFPDYGEAMGIAKNRLDGIDFLRSVFEGKNPSANL